MNHDDAVTEAAKALHYQSAIGVAQAMRPEQAERVLAERWDDLDPCAQQTMRDLAGAAVESYLEARR